MGQEADWDMPVFDFGHAITAEEIDEVVYEAITSPKARP